MKLCTSRFLFVFAIAMLLFVQYLPFSFCPLRTVAAEGGGEKPKLRLWAHRMEHVVLSDADRGELNIALSVHNVSHGAIFVDDCGVIRDLTFKVIDLKTKYVTTITTLKATFNETRRFRLLYPEMPKERRQEENVIYLEVKVKNSQIRNAFYNLKAEHPDIAKGAGDIIVAFSVDIYSLSVEKPISETIEVKIGDWRE